jgi:hypothetical protein
MIDAVIDKDYKPFLSGRITHCLINFLVNGIERCVRLKIEPLIYYLIVDICFVDRWTRPHSTPPPPSPSLYIEI